MNRCNSCGVEANGDVAVSKCSRCKEVSYCSRECQTADWRTHKNVCAKKRTSKPKAPFADDASPTSATPTAAPAAPSSSLPLPEGWSRGSAIPARNGCMHGRGIDAGTLMRIVAMPGPGTLFPGTTRTKRFSIGDTVTAEEVKIRFKLGPEEMPATVKGKPVPYGFAFASVVVEKKRTGESITAVFGTECLEILENRCLNDVLILSIKDDTLMAVKRGPLDGSGTHQGSSFFEQWLLPLYSRGWACMILLLKLSPTKAQEVLEFFMGIFGRGPYFFFTENVRGGASLVNQVVGADSFAAMAACLNSSGRKKLDTMLLRECAACDILNNALGGMIYQYHGHEGRAKCDPKWFGSACMGKLPCLPCLYLLEERGEDASAEYCKFLSQRKTALMSAAGACNLEGVCFLLLRGAARTIHSGGDDGCSALHYAINCDKMENKWDSRQLPSIISLLVYFGANLDIKDRAGFTPLFAAAAVGQCAGAKALLRRNAKVNTVLNSTSLEPDLTLKAFCENQVENRSRCSKGMFETSKVIMSAIREGQRRYVCDRLGCGKTEAEGSVKFKRCSQCRQARFCSDACTTEAWRKGHREVCQAAKTPNF